MDADFKPNFPSRRRASSSKTLLSGKYMYLQKNKFLWNDEWRAHFLIDNHVFLKSHVGGWPGFKGPRVMKFTQLINDHVSVQTEEEKGRRGKLELHGFHLTAAAKSTAALWPISQARRGRKTVPITVSPITGHSTATAVNTRRVMVCIGIFSLMFSHTFKAGEPLCYAAQLWALSNWLSTFNIICS